jgi:protein gp37
MEESKISWTDGTWNPWLGCDKVSAECDNCYIGRVLDKAGKSAWGEVYAAKTTWSLPQRMQRRAEKEQRRYKLFTCSLSDFFHSGADEWRPAAWDVIRKCPSVDFLVLTKRAERVARNLPADWGAGWPNVWLGVSVGIMKSAWRVDYLRKIPAAVHFISAEPLLESLNDLNIDGIEWLIAGGESGDSFRDMDKLWAEELRDKCALSGTTFFFKQGSGYKSGTDEDLLGKIYHEWPNRKDKE